MNERMRFDPAAAIRGGEIDADDLMVDLRNLCGDSSAIALNDALAGIIGLAIENRIEECHGRLGAFCSIIGPVLERAVAIEAKRLQLSASPNQAQTRSTSTTDEQRAIRAAIATCSRVSAGRIIAAHPEDDDAIVTLAELQIAARGLGPIFTETEGGEL